MANNSAIEWTDATWNPVVGCSVVSPGCTNCYAMKQAHDMVRRFKSAKYEGLTKVVNGNPVWTGEVRLDEKTLPWPLGVRKPKRIFVNSMSDLFHESLPDEAIDKVFAVMVLAPQHTFQVLTKRPERMQAYMSDSGRCGERWCDEAWKILGDSDPGPAPQWPLPNVWLGVTAEDQPRADERIPHLLATPAAKRFVSYEPALGPVDLTALMPDDIIMKLDGLSGKGEHLLGMKATTNHLDWVIAGGESGPNARAAHPDWFRSTRDQCADAGVPFFFKQWGEWLPGEANHGQFDARPMHSYRRCDNHSYEWPPGVHDRQNFGTDPDRFSGTMTTIRVGKKAAGAHLDGREHKEFPT